MLQFEDLTIDKWPAFKPMVLHSELFFPEKIRSPEDEYPSILSTPRCIAKLAFTDSGYAGNAIGYPLEGEDPREYGLDNGWQENGTIYLFNFVVEPGFQGRGIGQKLLLEFIKSAKQQGFKKVIGHFRPNTSLALIKKFHGHEIKVHPNWEDTGEDYVLCELDLEKTDGLSNS